MRWWRPTAADLQAHADAHPAHGGTSSVPVGGSLPTPRRRLGGLWLVRGLWGIELAVGGLDDTGHLYSVGALHWGHRHPLVALEATPLTADGAPVGMETT